MITYIYIYIYVNINVYFAIKINIKLSILLKNFLNTDNINKKKYIHTSMYVSKNSNKGNTMMR